MLGNAIKKYKIETKKDKETRDGNEIWGLGKHSLYRYATMCLVMHFA